MTHTITAPVPPRGRPDLARAVAPHVAAFMVRDRTSLRDSTQTARPARRFPLDAGRVLGLVLVAGSAGVSVGLYGGACTLLVRSVLG